MLTKLNKKEGICTNFNLSGSQKLKGSKSHKIYFVSPKLVLTFLGILMIQNIEI